MATPEHKNRVNTREFSISKIPGITVSLVSFVAACYYNFLNISGKYFWGYRKLTSDLFNITLASFLDGIHKAINDKSLDDTAKNFFSVAQVGKDYSDAYKSNIEKFNSDAKTFTEKGLPNVGLLTTEKLRKPENIFFASLMGNKTKLANFGSEKEYAGSPRELLDYYNKANAVFFGCLAVIGSRIYAASSTAGYTLGKGARLISSKEFSNDIVVGIAAMSHLYFVLHRALFLGESATLLGKAATCLTNSNFAGAQGHMGSAICRLTIADVFHLSTYGFMEGLINKNSATKDDFTITEKGGTLNFIKAVYYEHKSKIEERGKANTPADEYIKTMPQKNLFHQSSVTWWILYQAAGGPVDTAKDLKENRAKLEKAKCDLNAAIKHLEENDQNEGLVEALKNIDSRDKLNNFETKPPSNNNAETQVIGQALKAIGKRIDADEAIKQSKETLDKFFNGKTVLSNKQNFMYEFLMVMDSLEAGLMTALGLANWTAIKSARSCGESVRWLSDKTIEFAGGIAQSFNRAA